MARPQEHISLEEADRQALEAVLRSHKTPQSRALRARIILKSGAGESVESISGSLGTSTKSIYKWRNRFLEAGIDGLFDLPRSGQPKKLTEKDIKRVLTLTVERIPQEATHWSVRLMAKYAGVTAWQVRQIWQAADLKPHRIQTFKISNDPELPRRSLMLSVYI